MVGASLLVKDLSGEGDQGRTGPGWCGKLRGMGSTALDVAMLRAVNSLLGGLPEKFEVGFLIFWLMFLESI